MKVLVVEDDRYFARIIVESLADRGVDADVSGSVEDALERQSGSYDCTIIDVMLPNNPNLSGISDDETRSGYLAGVALARRIRKTHPQSKIILLSAAMANAEASRWAREQNIPFVLKEDARKDLSNALAALGMPANTKPPLAFIVHGHDEGALAELKDYLQNVLKWQKPLVLREQPSSGKTLIEKFEEFSEAVDYVFVLLTPDDATTDTGTNDQRRRSRQNVVFELGFFYAQMGRRSGRVVLLYKDPVELPSDISGVVWININNGIKAAGEDIRQELGIA